MSNPDENDIAGSAKVVFIGDSNVGKTSILNRYMNNNFETNEASTIAMSSNTIVQEYHGKKYKMYISDTAGQERFRSLSPLYFRDAKFAVVVFDVTETKSFESMDGWIDSFKESTDNKEVIIVANKIDKDIVISREEISQLASRYGADMFYVSASTGEGVSNIFDSIIEKMDKGETTCNSPRLANKTNSSCC